MSQSGPWGLLLKEDNVQQPKVQNGLVSFFLFSFILCYSLLLILFYSLLFSVVYSLLFSVILCCLFSFILFFSVLFSFNLLEQSPLNLKKIWGKKKPLKKCEQVPIRFCPLV